MLIRTVQLAVVAFWLTMTVLLVRLVYFPEETRLSEVPVERVLAGFLSNRAPAHLVILDGGREVGSVTVTHKSADGRGDGSEVEVALAGTLNTDPAGGRGDALRFLCQVALDAGSRPTGFRFGAQATATGGSVTVESRRGQPLAYRAVRDGEVIADSADESPGAGSIDAQARLLLAAFGIDLARLGAGGDGGMGVFAPVARQGTLTLGDHRFSAYTLEVPVPLGGGGTLRFIFTRTGELLKIDGLLNYEVVADLLRPGPGVPPGDAGG